MKILDKGGDRMKILDKFVCKNGTVIQLEDWSEHNSPEYPELYGLCIAAYPIARNTGKYGLIREGERFRLHIPYNKYANYQNSDVRNDYEMLKSGKKSLEDLADHFYDGDKAKWYFGMDVEYQGW